MIRKGKLKVEGKVYDVLVDDFKILEARLKLGGENSGQF